MALITKYYLMEQVEELLGDVSSGQKFEPETIWAHLQQAINKRLKLTYVNEILPQDETIPEGLVVASYDNVPVVTYKNKSRSLLPAMPISLRRNMGVAHVGTTTDWDAAFIPLQRHENVFVKSQKLINSLLDQIGYEQDGQYLVYNQDLTTRAAPITNVFMRLVVMDLDKYSDYDILPLPADMSGDVVREVADLLLKTPPQEQLTDPTRALTPDKR